MAGGSFSSRQGVGDRGSRLADPRRNLLLRQLEVLLQRAVGLGLFHRIEVGALEVFDQGELEKLAVVAHLTHHHGHHGEARALRCTPSPLSGDNRISPFSCRTYDQWLDHPLGSDRGRKLLELGIVELGSRLQAIGVDLGDGQASCRLGGLAWRNQGGKTASESALLVVHLVRLKSSLATAR